MKRIRTIIITIFILLGLAVGLGIGTLNQRVTVADTTRIYIPNNSDYSALLDTLDAHNCHKYWSIIYTISDKCKLTTIIH